MFGILVNALLCNEITTFYFRYKLMNLGTQMLCQVLLVLMKICRYECKKSISQVDLFFMVF
jgi:hypothetical protein